MLGLMRVKLQKISSYVRKPCSDTDLIKGLNAIKDNKLLDSQKELINIKELKKNISNKLV